MEHILHIGHAQGKRAVGVAGFRGSDFNMLEQSVKKLPYAFTGQAVAMLWQNEMQKV